jgi:hypothetical protein
MQKLLALFFGTQAVKPKVLHSKPSSSDQQLMWEAMERGKEHAHLHMC